MNKKTSCTSANANSGLLSIVGGHLIGLEDEVQLEIDFSIFNPEVKTYKIERIIYYNLLDKRESVLGLIDKTGREIAALKYKTLRDFNEGLACVQNLDGNFGFIDKQYVIHLQSLRE